MSKNIGWKGLVPGPWQGEGDRFEWTTKAGLVAFILRSSYYDNLNGYVAVPKRHPCHGKDILSPLVRSLSAHGPITYAADRLNGVLKTTAPADAWWLGFDCLHFCDMTAAWDPFALNEFAEGLGLPPSSDWIPEGLPEPKYRDVHYVRLQCESLARTLAAAQALVDVVNSGEMPPPPNESKPE